MAGENIFSDLIPASSAPGVLYGPAKKPEPVKTATVGNKFGVVGDDGSFTPTYDIPDDKAPPPLTDADKQALRDEALSKIKLGASLIKRSRDGYFKTGFGAGVTSMVGGTPSYGVKTDTETLKNAGALQRVIELSQKTGKNPLTPLSNSDFQALANSISNLDISQPDEQYQRNVGTLLDIYKRTYIASGGDPADIDKILGAQGVTDAPSDAPPSSGGTPPAGPQETTPRALGADATPGLSEMNDQQKAAYASFWKANADPTPEQLSGFLTSIGVPNVEKPAAEAIIKAVKSGAGYSTAIDRETVLRGRMGREDALGVNQADDITRLAQASAGASLTDEAAGVGGALANIVAAPLSDRVDLNPVQAYRDTRDIERLRIEDARKQLGYGGTAIELVGALGGGGPGTAVTRIRDIAKGGAAAGALAGYGSGDGLTDSTERALIGGTAGATVGALGGAYANRLASRGLDPELAAAAAAEDVRISGPMVEGRGQRARINKAGVLEADQATAPIVQQGFADTANDIEAAAGRLSSAGTARTDAQAGEMVQSAGRRFIQRSRGVAERLYNRARSLSGDERFTPQNAIRQADEELAALRANPESNQAEIAFVERYRNDLATDGGKSIAELRDLRTNLRGALNEAGLTAGTAEARVLRIIDAVNQDARTSLPRGAADAYRRADAYYRERMVHIDDVLDRFIGGDNGVAKLSGEQAFAKIKQMSNTDGRRLGAIMRDMSQAERLDIGATLAQSLGRRAPDEPFSLAAFLDHTRKLSPSARRTIFGPDGAQSIENLRMLTTRLQRAQAEVNRSKTGRPVLNAIRSQARLVVAGLMGSGGAAIGGAVGGGIGLAAAGTAMLARTGLRALSARALMSPRVSNWLASAANVGTRAQAQEAARRLGVIVAREPALAGELSPLQKFLNESLTTPAVASDGEGGDNAQP